MQSGACSDAFYVDPPAAEAQGEALAAALGCAGPDALACLRGKSADEVARALPAKRGLILRPGVWWGPVVDGVELPEIPLAAMRAGETARVPLLIGAARDEGVLHTFDFEEISAAEVDDFVAASFGEDATGAVAARYARATGKEALAAIIGDGIFVCQARRVARVLAEQGVPVFLYHWTRALADPRAHPLGATHGVDLFFVWGNPAGGIQLADEEQELAQLVMDAWGAFARDGDPSTEALRWPRYRRDRDEHAVLDLPASIGTDLGRDRCDFWDDLDAR
jgi:para-nitrobenzyl esterase